jgi:hypothetical protein
MLLGSPEVASSDTFLTARGTDAILRVERSPEKQVEFCNPTEKQFLD